MILIVQGHPDSSERHLCHVLATAYKEGAESKGHEVCLIEIASLEFPMVQNAQDFESGPRPECILRAQKLIKQADHVVFVFPLWLGTMPALLKAFLEQVFRYDFAFSGPSAAELKGDLTGKTARIIVTMGMPTLAYRWYFGAHGVKNLERSILKFSGFKKIKRSLFGSLENATEARITGWLERIRKFGERAI